MSEENRQDPLAKVESERRDFLKKIAIAAAFAAPTIATFSVDGMRKKAFAQAQYDAPEVLSFLRSVNDGEAVVTFTQPMDTGVGFDAGAAKKLLSCREYTTNPYYAGTWRWEGETRHVFSITDTCPDEDVDLYVSYNQDGCAEMFRNKQGIALVPFSGMVTISGYCGEV